MLHLNELLTPQAVAIALISMLLFGGMIAVDSIAVTKYPEFVKPSNIDIMVRVVNYQEEYSPAVLDKQKLQDVIVKLEQQSYVKNISTYYYMYKDVAFVNTSYYVNSITGVSPQSMPLLNISITSGAFLNNSVAVREDIFKALNMSFGDYINVSYSTESISTFVLLPITSTFTINNTLLENEIKLIVTPKTFEFISSKFYPFYLTAVVVADIDENIIDPKNPEIARDMFFHLQISLWNLSSDHTQVNVYFNLLGDLLRFIDWKNTFRYNVFLGLLPVIVVLWFVQYYLTELFFAKRKREINVMIARGSDPSIKTGLFLKHLGKATIIGASIGVVFSVPASRIFIIAPIEFLVYRIDVTQLQNVPYVLSWYSILFSIEYFLITIIVGILIYVMAKFYSIVVKSIAKKKKGLLKKLFLAVGGSYIDFVLLGYSLLIFMFVLLNTDLFSQINFSYNPILVALLYFAPFAFIIGATRVIFRAIDYIIKPLAYSIKNYKFLYPVYMGIKNLARKKSIAPAIGMIFALVIALSQTSGIIAQTYAPAVRAQEYWLYGSDFIIQFNMDIPNVTLANKIANLICENISVIKSHTMIMETGELLYSMTYVKFVGIDPKTFVQTIYTDSGTLFKDSAYADTIYSLQNVSNGVILSKLLADSLELEEDDVLKLFSWETGIFVNMRIIGILDYAFSRIMIGSYYIPYYQEYVPTAPSVYSSYSTNDISFARTYEYALTNYKIIEALNKSVSVSVIIRASQGANANVLFKTLQNRVTALKYKYLVLQDSWIESARIKTEQILNDAMIQTLRSTLNINFVASLIVVLIVLWDFGLLLKKKRSREIAVLLSLGESKAKIALIIMFELLFILIYGTIVGLFTSYPFSLITGKTIGISPFFILNFFTTDNFIWLAISCVLYALLFTVVIGYLVIYLVLHEDLSKLLKIEWSPEKLIEEIEVSFE